MTPQCLLFFHSKVNPDAESTTWTQQAGKTPPNSTAKGEMPPAQTTKPQSSIGQDTNLSWLSSAIAKGYNKAALPAQA